MRAGSWRSWPARVLRTVTDLFLPASLRVDGCDESAQLRGRAFIRVTLLILGGMLVLYAVWVLNAGLYHPTSVAWTLYVLLLVANLLLVRQTGRFYEVTLANNLAGLIMMAVLLHYTNGIASPLLPLFLTGVATTGNFGGKRAILYFFFGFLLLIFGTYGWQLYQGDPPTDIHSRFVLLLTALVLIVLANLSAQSSRSQTRRMLAKARDAALEGQRRAEQAQVAAERTLAELRDAQAQMILQEKMASLGSLVAGVAHEVNTPVGLTVTSASQLRQETASIQAQIANGELRRSALDEYLTTVDDLATLIEKNAVRAAELIQSFKDVAVDQSSDARRPFDLRPYVTEVLASLAPRLRHAGHKLHLAVPDGIILDGYPGSLAQVITNLVINSIVHGYPDGKRGGTLRLAARVLDGDLVELTYADDGVGIEPELWGRIFEPFFTTRRGSGGSGLGLHLLYNIVTVRMGGTVRVDAAVSGGAVFILTFPLVSPARPADTSRPDMSTHHVAVQ